MATSSESNHRILTLIVVPCASCHADLKLQLFLRDVSPRFAAKLLLLGLRVALCYSKFYLPSITFYFQISLPHQTAHRSPLDPLTHTRYIPASCIGTCRKSLCGQSEGPGRKRCQAPTSSSSPCDICGGPPMRSQPFSTPSSLDPVAHFPSLSHRQYGDSSMMGQGRRYH